MKIARVTARLLEATPQSGVTFGLGDFSTYSMVLVEITSDDGVTGYGEAIARRGGQMTVAAVEHLFGDVLIGKDPENIEGLWVLMVDQLRRWGHTQGVVVEAISGIDIALWDLVGKARNAPVWKLLTGAGRKEVPVYASSVYIADPNVMVDQALEQQQRGFSSLKVKIGRPHDRGGIWADLQVLEQIRSSVDDGMGLVVDANGAYDASTAIRLARAMESLDIGWFEEPLPPDDVTGYERLHSMTSTPLARGETDFGLWTLRDIMQRRTVDVVQPDLARCGGVTAARHVWTLTYFMNLAFAPHTGFSGGLSQLAALHVAAAAPELLALEYMFIDNPVRELFIDGYPKPVDGKLPVPQSSGLGLELDFELIDRLTVHPSRRI